MQRDEKSDKCKLLLLPPVMYCNCLFVLWVSLHHGFSHYPSFQAESSSLRPDLPRLSTPSLEFTTLGMTSSKAKLCFL